MVEVAVTYHYFLGLVLHQHTGHGTQKDAGKKAQKKDQNNGTKNHDFGHEP